MKIDHNDKLEQTLAEYELASAEHARLLRAYEEEKQRGLPPTEECIAALSAASSRGSSAYRRIHVPSLIERFRELQKCLAETEIDRDRWMRIAGEHTFERVMEDLQARYDVTSAGILASPGKSGPERRDWVRRREARQRRLAELKPFQPATHKDGCPVVLGKACECGAWQSDREQMNAKLQELEKIEQEFDGA